MSSKGRVVSGDSIYATLIEIQSHIFHFTKAVSGKRKIDIFVDLKKLLEIMIWLVRELDLESELSKELDAEEFGFKDGSKWMDEDEFLPTIWLRRLHEIVFDLKLLSSRYHSLIKFGNDGKLLGEAIDSLVIMSKYVTMHKHEACLLATDKFTEINEGGYMYAFKDGTILGYNRYVYENSEIIGGQKDSLLLFKRFEVRYALIC